MSLFVHNVHLVHNVQIMFDRSEGFVLDSLYRPEAQRSRRRIRVIRADLNLSRFAGVSEAGVRRRNPERSEGSTIRVIRADL